MSFLYPRTVSIRRPNAQIGGGSKPVWGAQTAGGQVAVGGLQPADETVIASNLPASIQRSERGRAIEAGLPADSDRRGLWSIYFQRNVLALGAVKKNDIVVDDLGNRYQVTDAYWNSMGTRLYAELMVT